MFSRLAPSRRIPYLQRFATCRMSTCPWNEPMSDSQFTFMRDILAAPSPVGLEAAMTRGVLQQRFDEKIAQAGWGIHTFKGNAGVVWDSMPEAARGSERPLTVMICGHADKIRMQVRSIGADGKIYINSDSFLPQTLLGNHVSMYSQDSDSGQYRRINGTVEALGAIHFAPPEFRTGKQGVSPNQLYLELGMHGKERKKQVEMLGIRPGDSIIMHRPITRCFAADTFSGAYLDNGLGCFVAAEVARLCVEGGGLRNVRVLSAFASHEEIGRFGSRVVAAELRPDVLIAADVNHDYEAAPIGKDEKFCHLEMGKGFTMSVGATVSEQLNRVIETAAKKRSIPYQRDVVGRDTGTDAMGGVLGAVDCAVTSIGFPIRNMHTISELGHTGDVLAAVHAVYGALLDMDECDKPICFRSGHPRLDMADNMPLQEKVPDLSDKKETE